MPNNCFCDQRGLGDPTQTCGDCPEDYREGAIGTHAQDCHSWGPKHYACALREIGRLRAALELISTSTYLPYARAIATGTLGREEPW